MKIELGKFRWHLISAQEYDYLQLLNEQSVQLRLEKQDLESRCNALDHEVDTYSKALDEAHNTIDDLNSQIMLLTGKLTVEVLTPPLPPSPPPVEKKSHKRKVLTVE